MVRTTENFIESAKKIHGDLYDYSYTTYSNIDTPVIISCREHGKFLKSPYEHLKGAGCQKCAFKKRGENNKKNTLQFIKEVSEKFGDTYSYDKIVYKTNKDSIIVTCFLHGDFLVTPSNFLNGTGCRKCKYEKLANNLKKGLDEQLEKANVVHNFVYDYSLVDYKKYNNINSKIKIICPIHGIFMQRLNNHIYSKSGCPSCAKERQVYSNTFTKTYWKNLDNSINKTLYLINCYNSNECFIKVGITGQTINNRFKSNWEMPYEYTVIDNIVSKKGSWVWEKELFFKKHFKSYKYLPNILFPGRYECFNNLNTNEYIDMFTKLKQNQNGDK